MEFFKFIKNRRKAARCKMVEYLDCLYVGCKTLRKEGELFCEQHKQQIRESERLIMCDLCGRIIKAERNERREVKEERYEICRSLYKESGE